MLIDTTAKSKDRKDEIKNIQEISRLTTNRVVKKKRWKFEDYDLVSGTKNYVYSISFNLSLLGAA